MTDPVTPPKDTAPQKPGLESADRFAAVVLRDLLNPLEAATHLAYLAYEETGRPEVVRQYIRLLKEQLATIAEVARNAHNFYKSPHKAVDLVKVVEATLRMHAVRITDKSLRLSRSLPHEALIRANAGEMLQVVFNLLANAIDALPLEGALTLRIQQRGGEVHITIHDTGHGIPQSILKKVYDPFFTTRGEHGTGLGLFISKSIVERHNGRVRMRSSTRVGRSGTIFRVSLPIHQPS